MATRSKGRNPFDRLRNHFDDIDLRCSECGYEDDEGAWESFTDGREVTYQHVCSNCGKVRMRRVSVAR